MQEIQKNRITELISALKGMSVGFNDLILTESDILKRHSNELMKDSNFKKRLDGLCQSSEDLKTDIDNILTQPIFKNTKAEFDEGLHHFFGIQDTTKGRAQKVLFQVTLILEVLINKLIAIDKFKIMHLISKLKTKGEDVKVHIDQYTSLDYFGGKRMNLYFELLNKVLKHTSTHSTPVKEEVKEPGIHVSGSFEEYLVKQVNCKITEEFANYINCILSQTKAEADQKIIQLTDEHQKSLTKITAEKDILQQEKDCLQADLIQKQELIRELHSANDAQIFTLSECDKKEELIEKLKKEIEILGK